MVFGLSAQSQFGEVRGEVHDKKTGKALEEASVKIELNGSLKGSTITNENGNFSFKTLSPGEYTIKLELVGYEKIQLEDVVVSIDQITFVKLEPEPASSTDLGTFKKKAYRVPIINPDGVNGTTMTAKNLTNIPTRNINTIVGQSANVNSFGGSTPTFSGSRSSGTAYYIDGVRVIGSFSVPRSSIDQIQVVASGTPAQYGDFTGGVINVTTKGPSRVHQGGLEAISSSATDPYHFNQFEFALQGPIMIKFKKTVKERVVLGYSTSGNFIYQKDPNPSAYNITYLKPEVLADLEKTPLKPSPSGSGFVNRAEFVTKDDFYTQKAKINTNRFDVNMTGSINWQPSKNVNIAIGGTASYVDLINYNYANNLFNYQNNSRSTSGTYRGWLRFTHVLKKEEKKKAEKTSKSIVSSAYYTIRFDYTQTNGLTEDAVHKDNLFDYGYLGKYTNYRAAGYQVNHGSSSPASVNRKPRQFNGKSPYTGNDTAVLMRDYTEQIVFSDTLLKFERSEINAVRANYTSTVFNYFDNLDGGKINSLDFLQINNGLRNGDNPTSPYNMWSNMGSAGSGYNKSTNEQYTLFAMSEVTLRSKNDPDKKHDLQFGLTYEQRIQRGYGVATTGLWTLARQLATLDKPKRDVNNALLTWDANGVLQDTVRYNWLVDPTTESNFSKNLRKHLMETNQTDANGKPIEQNSYLDVDMYAPSDLKLTYFSPDELINNGASYVDYFGYDVYGKKVKGKRSISEYLNSPNRVISAFQPVYTAFFVQDKFAFKDLIFRIGLRIDRYDANQAVLKDPFSLYPVRTVREVKAEGTNLSSLINSTMADDNVVYVNDVERPTKIVGYRQTSATNGVTRWFDKEGNLVNDPTNIANQTSDGRIAPYLVDLNKNQKITEKSFKDYKPQLYFMPRIWFKFPISTTAQFFANYDILTQRPDAANISAIDDYVFLVARANNQNFSNPALKPQRTTSYELGFKQQMGDNAGLSLIATYRELRDMLAVIKYNKAYPLDYTTYGNIDFGTVKGFRVEYELRDAGAKQNLNVNANYSLLFADGTGSNAGSQQSLLNAGQPNLRTLFPLDYDVRHSIKANFDFHFHDKEGPIRKGKYPLQNAGVNLILQAFSGSPYTANSQPINEGQAGVVQRSQIRGTVNGSRRPWLSNIDMTVDKTWNLNTTRKARRDGKKPMNINAYIWASNILNIKNITGVYRYTGSATDDGFIASPQGQNLLRNQLSAQSFADLYTTRVANPGNFYTPRLIRLGLRFNF
jgi:hypothetical protein